MRIIANKFHAKKVIFNGITFDSKKECERYKELKILEDNKTIKNLELQKKFILIPKQTKEIEETTKTGKVKNKTITLEREVSYVADFYYIDKYGNEIVEDVKGCKFGAAYNIFVLKRKMMLYFYNIQIKEI